MKLKKPFPGIFHVECKDQYELTSTFCRLQEFYESPSKKLKNQIFDMEEFMDAYAKLAGDMTYFTDWNGFNVPGHIVDQFVELQGWDLRLKEEIFADISGANDPTDFGGVRIPYYVIGTHKKRNDCYEHELCHAFFYLDKVYKVRVIDLVNGLQQEKPKVYNKVKKWLLKNGYSKSVLVDEINAYMATSGKKWLEKNIPGVYPYAKMFEQAYKLERKEFSGYGGGYS